MNQLCNILWFIFGGVWMGMHWWLAGLLCFISILGIPWGRACFVIGLFAFCPFGKVAIDRDLLSGQKDIGTGFWGAVGNILWLPFVGIWIALGHLGWAIICALTIIGIPFAWQHIKLAALTLCPIGKTIVPVNEAENEIAGCW